MHRQQMKATGSATHLFLSLPVLIYSGVDVITWPIENSFVADHTPCIRWLVQSNMQWDSMSSHIDLRVTFAACDMAHMAHMAHMDTCIDGSC